MFIRSKFPLKFTFSSSNLMIWLCDIHTYIHTYRKWLLIVLSDVKIKFCVLMRKILFNLFIFLVWALCWSVLDLDMIIPSHEWTSHFSFPAQLNNLHIQIISIQSIPLSIDYQSINTQLNIITCTYLDSNDLAQNYK